MLNVHGRRRVDGEDMTPPLVVRLRELRKLRDEHTQVSVAGAGCRVVWVDHRERRVLLRSCWWWWRKSGSRRRAVVGRSPLRGGAVSHLYGAGALDERGGAVGKTMHRDLLGAYRCVSRPCALA